LQGAGGAAESATASALQHSRSGKIGKPDGFQMVTIFKKKHSPIG